MKIFLQQFTSVKFYLIFHIQNFNIFFRNILFYFFFSLQMNIQKIEIKKISVLSESESVKFLLIELVICPFTDSFVKRIFFTVKSVNFHC